MGPYEADRQFSILAFVDSMRQGLCDQGFTVKVCAPSQTSMGQRLRPILRRRATFYDKFVAFIPELKRHAKEADAVLIAEHGYAMYQKSLRSVPHAVVCHDLIVAKAALGEINDWPLSLPAKRYQYSILKNLKSADWVAAASNATLEDVLRLTGRSVERTRTIYDGFVRQMPRMEESAAMQYVAELGIDPKTRFLLHVGGNQANKNKLGVVQIVGELQKLGVADLGLVMAGARPEAQVLTAIAGLPNPARVKIVELPSDEQVRALYSCATALLFPSKYEGFGLPIIEAQASGCPVITTNRAPMTEVAGDAALLIDPDHPRDAASSIANRLPDIHDLIEPGLQNSARFATRNMIDGYATLLGDMVK